MKPWLNVIIAIIILGFSTSQIIAQPLPQGSPKPPGNPQPGNGTNYPWNNDINVMKFTVSSKNVTGAKVWIWPRAGVSTITRMTDGRLIAAFQYFPGTPQDPLFDKVHVSFSSQEGLNWTIPIPINVTGMPTNLQRPFDPTLVVLPEEDKIRIYFTSTTVGENKKMGTPSIYSAISTDGINFSFEKGVRFSVENRVVIDCAVARDGKGTYHLISPDNGESVPGMPVGIPSASVTNTGYHAISTDGLNFTRVDNVTNLGGATSGNKWLGNLQSDDGRLYFFGTGRGPWPFSSDDGGNSWGSVPGLSLNIPGADAGAVKLEDGSWLVTYTAANNQQNGSPGNGGPGGRKLKL